MSSGLALESGVTFAKPAQMPRLRYHRLALDTANDRLVVVQGPKLQGETQFWGPMPIPCDGTGTIDSQPVNVGLTLYELGSTSATLVGHLQEGDVQAGEFDGAPVGAAIRESSSPQLHIAVANNTQGYTSVLGNDQGANWDMDIASAFDNADGQPTGAHDDVDFLPGLPDGAHVSCENGLSTLQHSSGETLLDLLDLNSTGGVLTLAGLNYLGQAPRIYNTAQEGYRITDASDPDNPLPASVILDTGGKAFEMALGYQLPGYPPTTNPPRWLFLVNAGDCLTSGDCDSPGRPMPTSGGLRVYEVGDATVPTASMLIGAAYEGMEDQLDVDLTGAFIGVTLRENPATYDVWILYSENKEPADEVGVIHIEASRGPGNSVHLAPAGRYPVPNATSWDNSQGTAVGRVRYLNGKLYAGLGAAGVGIFDVATGTWTYRHLPNMIVLAALPGSDGEVYFTTLRNFVGILPEATLTTATPTLVPTRYQTIMMRAEPGDPDILWLPEGHGGLERLDLSGF